MLPRSPAKHGLSEQLPCNGTEPANASLIAYRSSASTFNVYDSFQKVLTGRSISHPSVTINVADLLPQLLQGHRIWCGIVGETERFISLDSIRFLSDSKTKRIWLALYVYADDLSRLGLSRKKFLQGAGFNEIFHEVNHKKIKNARPTEI